MPRNAGRAVSLVASLFAFSLHVQPQSLREAAQLDAEGKCDEAERLYEAALSNGSPSAALLNNTGNHYLACGQAAKAQTHFERLLHINPLHPNANLQLARIATEQKQGAKALEYLSRVKESDPVILLLRAEALHWAGRHTASVAMLNVAEKSANGDIDDLESHSRQHDTMFENAGGKEFLDVSQKMGDDFLRIGFQRGSALQT